MAKTATSKKKPEELFSAEEKAAMQERVKELKAEKRAASNRAEGEAAVKEKIGAMPENDRKMGEKLHAIITSNAPDLIPRTWYGMPAYSNKDGKVICFFRGSQVFKERYLTLGFNQDAKLDDGSMWPVAFALTSLTSADEEKIAALVRKAVQ